MSISEYVCSIDHGSCGTRIVVREITAANIMLVVSCVLTSPSFISISFPLYNCAGCIAKAVGQLGAACAGWPLEQMVCECVKFE